MNKATTPDQLTDQHYSEIESVILAERRPDIHGLMMLGAMVVALFFGALFVWSVLAPLSTGAIVSGQVTVEGDRQMIEHLEGGIVRTIHVSNGDVVQIGSPLIDMENAQAYGQKRELVSQLIAMEARRARLWAEKGNQSRVDYSSLTVTDVPQETLSDILGLEDTMFQERQASYREKLATLMGTVQARLDIIMRLDGVKERLQAQLALIQQEITDVTSLFEKGLAPKTRLLALERQRERLFAEILEHDSRLIGEQDRLTEARTNLLQFEAERREKLAQELEGVRLETESYQAKLAVINDQIMRANITSPQQGVVMDLRVNSVGEVIQPGGAVLDIVPQDAKLVVSGRMQAGDGANVGPGLPVKLTVQAFKGRNAPQLDGEVISVSPDTLIDEQTGETYYQVKIAFDETSLAELSPKHVLQPGFPVQGVIETASQPVVAYLLGPILTTIENAFVEP